MCVFPQFGMKMDEFELMINIFCDWLCKGFAWAMLGVCTAMPITCTVIPVRAVKYRSAWDITRLCKLSV